jgi:quercetin dioxygenase-like cupin family protein
MNPLIHFKKTRILRLFIAAAFATLAALTAAPALATPACGLTTSNLLYPGQPVDTAHAAHFPSRSLDLMCEDLRVWDLITRIRGDSDVYIVQNTWPPGAHSGWHTHPGPSLITVISGELTDYEASNPTCTPITYTAGQSFTDPGCGDVHLIRNEGTVCAVNVVVQIVPAGAPRRIDAGQPANCPMFACASPTPCP